MRPSDHTHEHEPAAPPFQWEALLESARQFAHTCLKNYSVQEAAFFFLHAGASVELGIKAALCRVSPVLLMEGGHRFKDQALIRLLGLQPFGAQLGAEAPPLFTVGFEQAIKRFQLLHGSQALGAGQSALDELKSARDVTAHGGAVMEVEADRMLRILVTLCNVHAALAPHFQQTPEQFWGELYSLVERAMREEKDARRQQVDALVGAAQRRFQQEYGDVDPDTVSAVLQQVNERVQWEYGHDRRSCPVCGAEGLARVRPVKRTVLRSRKPHIQRGWLALDFRCSVCKLWLPTEDLVKLTEGLESWAPAVEKWELEFWAEDRERNAEMDADDYWDLYGLDEDDVADLRDTPRSAGDVP